MGKVSKRARYDDKSTGKVNYNAMYDKFLYEVGYSAGTMEQLAANIIAENIPSQVDAEGHHYQVLTEVTDQKRDEIAISNVDGFINSSSGNLHRKRRTCGWKLLVDWKEGSVDWVPLKELKQYNPVYMVEYSVSNEIRDEPAFNWWVKETL